MAEFTPQELEEQRRRANALRGQQMIGALASTSQIPGAAQQGMVAQRIGQQGLQEAARTNESSLDRRDMQEQRALKRAMEADALAYQKEQDALANARAEAEANRRRTTTLSPGAKLVDEDTGDEIARGDAKTSRSGKGDEEEGSVYDQAIGELKKARYLVSDQAPSQANTGPIAQMMPTMRPGSVQLEQVQNQLALYEIPKYTFGSLSEAEGQWLKDTVLPTNLDEEELQVWIDNKINAYEIINEMDAYVKEAKEAGEEVDQDILDAMQEQIEFPSSIYGKEERRRGPQR